jgi:hypothetical protein
VQRSDNIRRYDRLAGNRNAIRWYIRRIGKGYRVSRREPFNLGSDTFGYSPQERRHDYA